MAIELPIELFNVPLVLSSWQAYLTVCLSNFSWSTSLALRISDRIAHSETIEQRIPLVAQGSHVILFSQEWREISFQILSLTLYTVDIF